jgi:hypothetical protein
MRWLSFFHFTHSTGLFFDRALVVEEIFYFSVQGVRASARMSELVSVPALAGRSGR